jgi:hypothetical protein
LPSDAVFAVDEWISFQHIEWTFRKLDDVSTIKERMDQWSREHFNIDANIVVTSLTSTDYMYKMVQQKPSQVIQNTTHIVVICPSNNTILVLCDHYFCDGNTLMGVFKHLFSNFRPTLPCFPKYTYIPGISDAMAGEFCYRQLFESRQYPSQLSGVDDKTTVLTQSFDSTTVQRKWDRWANYARATIQLFDALTSDVKYLRFGLTVGFNTDQFFTNNRIGVIFVRIHRPASELSYDEQFDDIAKQFRDQVMTRYMDAHTSYDLVRDFASSTFREYGRKAIDGMFTALYIKEAVPGIISGAGAFVGSFMDYEWIYINTITTGTKTAITYNLNLKQLDFSKMEQNGMSVRYSYQHSQ